MKSIAVSPGQTGTAAQYNNLRADAYGGSMLLPHAQTSPNLTLLVEQGVAYIGAIRVIFAGGNSPSFSAPVTHPRIDILTIDNTGTLAITQGTEATSPVVPAYPANKAVLCEIFNRVGETSIKDTDDTVNGYVLNDVRPVIAPPYISSTSQVASGLFVPDPGSDAQGDLLYYGTSAWTRLPAGTSGQFLKTLGTGANPQWGAITVGETDGTVTNQSLTATTSLQTDNITVTHGLGRTPAFIRLSCQIGAGNNPSSGLLTGQMDMTYNGSGTAVAGFTATYFSASSSYSAGTFSFGGAATTFGVATTGATAGSTVTVSITSISTTQFTLHITYQVTTGTGTLTCSVNNISWAVIG